MAFLDMYAPSFGGTLLTGLREVAVDAGVQTSRERFDGSPFSKQSSILQARRRVSLNGVDVASILGLTGIAGADVATVILFDRLKSKGGVFTSGSVHQKYTLATAYAVPETLTARHGELASMSFSLHGQDADGADDPLVLAASQAIADLSLGGGSSQFGLGPVVIDPTGVATAVTVTSKTEVALNFGVTPEYDAVDGDIYDKSVGTQIAHPVLNITTLDPRLWSTFGGEICIEALTFYLRKRQPCGVYYADDATEHVKITSGAGTLIPEQVSGQRRQFRFRLELHQESDGSLPLVIATGQAIT